MLLKLENVKCVHCSNITHASMLFATDRFEYSTPKKKHVLVYFDSRSNYCGDCNAVYVDDQGNDVDCDIATL